MGLTEPADDEDEMISALKTIAHTIRVGPKPHQKRVDCNRGPKPLTKRQVDWVVAQVQQGKIDLPDLHQLDDDDFTMVWALVDSGSAAHVADARRHFPGATVRESDAQRRGVHYVGATGDQIANLGEAQVSYWTPDGQQRMTTFQNATVGMPILSTSLICEEGTRSHTQHVVATSFTSLLG